MAAKNQTGCDCLLNQGPSGWANFQQLDSSTTIFLSVLTSRRKLCAYNQTQKSYKPCFLGLENLTWKSFFGQIKMKHAKLLCCAWVIVGDHLQAWACVWIILIAWRVQVEGTRAEKHATCSVGSPAPPSKEPISFPSFGNLLSSFGIFSWSK